MNDLIRVAVPSPLHQLFDYRLPDDVEMPQAGCRVLVPFGRRKLVGMVIETGVSADIDARRIKAVEKIIDDSPLISSDDLTFFRWITRYYHHPLGETLATGLPNALAKGEPATRTPEWAWRITPLGRDLASDALKRAPRQAFLLKRIGDHPKGMPSASLSCLDFDWQAPLRALREKGLVEKVNLSASEEPAHLKAAPTLNEEQRAAVDAVLTRTTTFKPYLLEGITGSGKTEVYLGIAEQMITQGRQVLLLVPEIGLTPQLTDRFRQRLGNRFAALHSGLTDRARLDAWLDARDGRVDWVIGTRSALFTPLQRPGLIIIDEEHDPSYKQQDGLRYSARDLALIRAREWQVPVVLGSATPSLETLHKALSGQYGHLQLKRRAGNAVAPRIRLQDIRNLKLTDGIAEPLFQAINDTLENQQQVLLFLNRRGYAPVLSCHHCGWVAECRRCDARLTLHQGDRRLRCHHCGHEQRADDDCPACGSSELVRLGAGTQRIEDILAERFTDIPIDRIDRDATRRKGELERKLAEAHRGEPRILVGTQMLAKGHDFPNVGLVGIVNGDEGLFGLDFRAMERTAQMIVQVAGRAGRGDRPGEVIIQTRHPESAELAVLLGQGYAALARQQLLEREMAEMPPHAHLALLRADSTKPGLALDFLTQAAQATRQAAIEGLQLWGPAHAPMEKRAGRYRAQLLIQHRQRPQLHKALYLGIQQWPSLPLARKVRWSLDVDPGDLY